MRLFRKPYKIGSYVEAIDNLIAQYAAFEHLPSYSRCPLCWAAGFRYDGKPFCGNCIWVVFTGIECVSYKAKRAALVVDNAWEHPDRRISRIGLTCQELTDRAIARLYKWRRWCQQLDWLETMETLEKESNNAM